MAVAPTTDSQIDTPFHIRSAYNSITASTNKLTRQSKI